MFDETLESFKKIAAERAEERTACSNCGWFAAHKDEKVGECHRYPPTFVEMADEEWKHARTSRDNVCGEFVHKRTGMSFQPDPYRAIAVRLARVEEDNERLRRAVEDV